MNAVLTVSLFVLLALASQASAAQKAYCGFNNFHRWSGCGHRNKVNTSPILCYDAFPGYTSRSRWCVESFLCGDPICDKKGGDYDVCWKRIVRECRSLGLYKEEP